MMFLYSLKLFNSNIGKALKLLLFYVVIWGLCVAFLLPVFFEFGSLFTEGFNEAMTYSSFSGVFKGSVGMGLYALIHIVKEVCIQIFVQNLGLAVYGLIVLFLIMPMLLSLGNFAFCEMLHSYMSSKSKLGFFSALVKGLKRSLLYATFKVLFNLLFFGILFSVAYGLALVNNEGFVLYALPILLFVTFVLLFSLRQLLFLGYMPALIVFDCGSFTAYHKGLKAVKRHFFATLFTTMLFFALFWLLVLIFGLYSLVALIPIMAVVMNVYNVVAFFCSQGMRFYFNNENILTPKKLEEVDNINKTAFIL